MASGDQLTGQKYVAPEKKTREINWIVETRMN